MLHYDTKKLRWDYDIPTSIEYIVEVDENCEICKNSLVKDWSSEFIIGNIPYDQIIIALEKYFGFVCTPEMIINHKKHIRTNLITDSELIEESKEQMKLIESNIPRQINEKEALESLLQGLYSRKLFLEKSKEYGREYIFLTQQLKQAIELKLKMKDELKEDKERVSLTDVIKLFEVKNQYDSARQPSAFATRRTWVRDGSRESIEYFVRFKQREHKSSSGINISN